MRLSRRRRECCRVASCPAQASPASLPCPCPVPQVGWPHKNVVRELLQKPDGVSIVLKKVPVPESPPQVHATQPCPPPPLLSGPQSVASSITVFLLVPQTPPQALGSAHPVSPSLAPLLPSPR